MKKEGSRCEATETLGRGFKVLWVFFKMENGEQHEAQIKEESVVSCPVPPTTQL